MLDAERTFSGSAGRRWQLPRWLVTVVVWWSDVARVTYFYSLSQRITKLVDPFLYQLAPRGNIQLSII